MKFNRLDIKTVIGWTAGILAVIGLIIILLARTPVQATLEAELPAVQPGTLVIDLAPDQMWQHFFRPSTVELIAGPNQGIVNTGSQPLKLKISTSGILDQASIHADNLSLDDNSYTLADLLMPQTSLPLKVKIKLPADKIHNHLIGDGYLHFIDLTSGKEIGAVQIKIIDSSIAGDEASESPAQDSCCEI